MSNKNGNSQIDNTLLNLLDDYLIITTVNKNYLHIFDIWYHYFKQSEYGSILRVITLDKKSEKYISNKSIVTIHPGKYSESFSKIIQWRFEEISKLLNQGKNIIQTDADAFWLHPKISNIVNKEFDIQSSIGYGIPIQAVDTWGFSLCTGFMVIQSNDRVINFMKDWIEKCNSLKDDQIAFNNLLLEESGSAWELNKTTKNYSFSKKYNLKIEAIDVNLVSRPFQKGINVYHPYLKSNHQLIKIIILYNRLKAHNLVDDYLKTHFMRVIFNPLNWVLSTYGQVKVVFHKAIKKLTVK